MKGVLLAALLLSAPAAARAQAIDFTKGGPVEVTASDGIELRQSEQMVIARGNARAVRGDVTVTADRLVAHYRKKADKAPDATADKAAPDKGAAPGTAGDTGNNEIYRLEAEGNVHIFTATDLAVADRAIYDIDQAVLLLTGSALKLTTPQQVVTARDAVEYWSAKHMAVARGDAVVTSADGRRVSGDTLVAYTTPPDQPSAAQSSPGAAQPSSGAGGVKPTSPSRAKPGGDPLLSSGKLQRVEGFGNVEVRTATEVIRANRGVYVPDTGIARLAGSVHLTRGQNQLNGDEAVVNLRTGISTLSRVPGSRVQGLVVPNSATSAAPGDAPASAPAKEGNQGKGKPAKGAPP